MAGKNYDWFGPISSLNSCLQMPNRYTIKDLYDPRRWRLNPLNIYEGVQNLREESATRSNYHTSSKHGAHNTLTDAMARVFPRPTSDRRPMSCMNNKYTDEPVDYQGRQGRFNSEAWEAYSWRIAKRWFEVGMPNDWSVKWCHRKPNNDNPHSSWNSWLLFPNADVGISIENNGHIGNTIITEVSCAKVAINYMPSDDGTHGNTIDAWNGQMFPCHRPADNGDAPVRLDDRVTLRCTNLVGTVQPGHIGIRFNGYILEIIPPTGALDYLKYCLGAS
ncbi:hypothetical protein [Zooshikella ganghwensis]|uniref:hypothetical protein n=1 Tax=Zooshikella ganghwensis TaxID=202772 RepID=UPI000413A3F9|nr:hypothetical protein [Zooshikella ganghwensis]